MQVVLLCLECIAFRITDSRSKVELEPGDEAVLFLVGQDQRSVVSVGTISLAIVNANDRRFRGSNGTKHLAVF
ncbi:MAG TPA: hypothetical protein DDW52_21840 [Planctomycetaceae bacterium]|nr:hypothetical protein [Planctomycetaceae bacterium]